MKRYTSLVLVIVMIMSFLPTQIFANYQQPIKAVTRIELTSQANPIPGRDQIYPNVSIAFTKPDPNGNNPANHQDQSKGPEGYDITFTNLVTGASAIQEGLQEREFQQNGDELGATFGYKGDYPANINDPWETFLTSGSLYEIAIDPYHYHVVTNAMGNLDRTKYKTLDPTATRKGSPAYAITDFNIVADTSDGLKYSFEYIPGVTYELYYGVIDPNDLPQRPADITPNPRVITPTEAEANSANGLVTWSINADRVLPGQPYAAAVVVQSIESTRGNGLSITNAAKVKFNNASSRAPKIVYATPELKLYLYNIYEDRIRLVWETLPAWLQINNNLESVTIMSRRKGAEDDAWETLATFTKDLQYFDYLRPKEEAEYQVIFQTSSLGQIKTNIATSETSEVLDIPYAPRVPTEFPALEVSKMDAEALNAWLATHTTLNEFLTADENKNYDDARITSRVDVPEFTEHTFHYKLSDNNTPEIQLVWDVMKEQLSEESSLYYDIYVSEDIDNIDNIGNRVFTDLPSSEVDPITKSDDTLVGNKVQFNVNKTNTTYYIKIIAKSVPGMDVRYWSPPTSVSITIEKVGDIFEPPVLGKPPLQIEAKYENNLHALDVKWTKEWYEVQVKDSELLEQYAQNDPDDALSHNERLLAQYGMSKIYFYDEGNSPYLRYIPKTGNTKTDNYELYGANASSLLKEVENKVNARYGDNYYQDHYLDNFLRLADDTHYEVLVMSDNDFSIAKGNNTVEGYISGGDILVDYQWTPIDDFIEPTVVNDMNGLLYTVANDYLGNPLEGNRSYIVMLRTYRYVNGEQKWCVMPSYIIGSTLSDFTSNPVVPKTPTLTLDKVGMTSIAVTWPYDDKFNYELVYSRLDNPDTATVWQFTEEDQKTFVNDKTAKATITGLLPETEYNVWIRASQKPESVDDPANVRISAWSNPVNTKTLGLTKPDPPGGLGLASYQSIIEAGKDFMPRLSDSLTLEWSRHMDDINPSDEAIKYTYKIEFSNNLDFMDSVIVNTSTGLENNGQIPFEIIASNLVQFKELDADTPYYARAQTILTYQKDDKVIELESDWCERIRITTTTSNEEYDGGENPYVTIYPDPVKESFKDGVWTYELVDAAQLTTQILKNKAQNYAISLKNYNGKQDANKRIVKMPMKVMQTLLSQGMNVQFTTNIGTYEIPAKALESYVSGNSPTDTVEFDLTKLTANDIDSYIKEGTYQTGERFEVKVRDAVKSTPIYTLNQPMTVKLNTENKNSDDYRISSEQPYLYNYNKDEWTKQNATVENGALKYSTPYVGLNAIYGETFTGDVTNSNYLMKALSGVYNIKGSANSGDTVNANEYVALLLGIAKNADTIDLTTSASENDYNAAKASGLYISNTRGNITKEQALNGCIRLYELKHGNAIKPSNATLEGFSSNYQQSAQKAYAVGMISEVESPQSTITYGELFDWIAYAIDGI